MIDADAISALVKYNCDVISGLIIVDDGVLTAGAKGLKLLLVNTQFNSIKNPWNLVGWYVKDGTIISSI